ncbi:MAG: nuclear transport factor 2 family protein [Candidatus Binatia bacterium]
MTTVVEEKDAIREAIAEYCFRIDAADYPRWVELFAENGSFEVVGMFKFQGRENLLAFAKSIPLNEKGLPGFKHCTLNHVIQVTGERATARCYFLLVHEGQPLRVDVAGRYQDVLVKENGCWLFESRTVTFDLHSLPGR